MKNTFKKRTIADTLHLLCKAKGEPVFRNGDVAQTALARETGVNQSLLSRILGGSSLRMTDANVLKIASYFSVNSSQVRGEQPIAGIDPDVPAKGDPKQIAELLEVAEKLTPSELAEAIEIIKIKVKFSATPEYYKTDQ